MAVTTKVLAASQVVSSSFSTVVYQAPTRVTTIVDKFTCRNLDTVSSDVSIWIVSYLDGVPSDTNLIVKKTLAAGETYIFPEMVGQVLSGGDIQGMNDELYMQSSVASSIMVRVSGREIN